RSVSLYYPLAYDTLLCLHVFFDLCPRVVVSCFFSVFFFLMRRRPPISTLFPYTTLFRSYYSGDDQLNLPWLSVGACGFVSVIGHVAATRLVELRRAFLDGDVTRAGEINRGLLPLFDAQRALGGVSMSKAALELLGIPAGAPRLPQLPPTTEQLDALAALLRRAGVNI